MSQTLINGRAISGFVNPADSYYQPEHSSEDFRKFREADMFQIFDAFYGMEPTKRKQFFHEELGQLNKGVEIANTAITGGGAGNAATITIAASEHTNSGTLSPYRLKDILRLVDGTNDIAVYVTAKNTTTPNAHTLTVVPTLSTADVASLVIANPAYAVKIGNAAADGSDFSGSQVRLTELIDNNTQLFDSSWTGDESELAESSFVEYDGKQFLYPRFMEDVMTDFHLDIAHSLLFGPGKTNQAALIDPLSGDNLTADLTKSLEQFIREFGKVQVYTTWDNTEQEELEDFLTDGRLPDVYLSMGGNKFYQSVNSYIGTQAQLWGGEPNPSNDIGEALFKDTGSTKVYGFDYAGFKRGNMTFLNLRARFFDYIGRLGFKNAAGTASLPYNSMAFYMPYGGDKVYDQGHAESTYREHIMLRYKDNGWTRRLFNQEGKPEQAPSQGYQGIDQLSSVVQYTVRGKQQTRTKKVEVLMDAEVGIQVVKPSFFALVEK